MTEWSNKTVVLPQWDLWVWKICSLWQYYCRSLSALHPVSTAASVDCCGRMIDGRLFLMVREYGQLGQNNMETSAADLQQVRSHLVSFPTYLSNWDTISVWVASGFISLGVGVKTLYIWLTGHLIAEGAGPQEWWILLYIRGIYENMFVQVHPG